MPDLAALGWDSFFAGHFAALDRPGLTPGRVALEHQHLYRVFTEQADLLARVAGRLRHKATGRHDFPAVGDWVAVRLSAHDRAVTIHATLPRKSRFSRKVAGETTEEQVLAANIDTVFVMAGLDHDFNLRRIERFLTAAWDSQASPVVILNKADVCDDPERMASEVGLVAAGVPIHVISSLRSENLEALAPYLRPGQTVALLGASGVGKSTLANRLLGKELIKTREVRASDSRGRHTTTHRSLFLLPGGGLLIDTPGLRELQLWETGEGLQQTFEDIERLARDCHFRDCRHEEEPRCAVKQAVSEGALSDARLENYRKIQKELDHLVVKQDQFAQLEQKRQWKAIHKAARDFKPRE